MPDRITSIHNDDVRYVRRLARRSTRQQEGCYLVEGVRLLEEALRSQADIERFYFAEEAMADRRVADIVARLAGAVRTRVVTPAVLAAMSDTETPAGLLAVVRMPRRSWPETLKKAAGGPDPVVILGLDNLRDPGNLGTILRSAEAFGASLLLLGPGCVDLYGPKAVRASMGAVFRLPAVPSVPLVEAVAEARRLWPDLRVLGLAASGTVRLSGADLRPPVFWLVGGEAEGLTPEVATLADDLVQIPMQRGVESLNAAVAAALALYEGMLRRSGY